MKCYAMVWVSSRWAVIVQTIVWIFSVISTSEQKNKSQFKRKSAIYGEINKCVYAHWPSWKFALLAVSVYSLEKNKEVQSVWEGAAGLGKNVSSFSCLLIGEDFIKLTEFWAMSFNSCKCYWAIRESRVSICINMQQARKVLKKIAVAYCFFKK